MSEYELTVADLVSTLDLHQAAIVGNSDAVVGRPGAIDHPSTTDFAFCKWGGERGSHLVRESRASVIVCPTEANELWRAPHQTLIRSANPRRTFIQALPHVVTATVWPLGVHASAIVDPSAFIDPTASIGANVSIGANASVGVHTIVHPNVVIGHDVRIGDRVTIFSGTVVGSDGFGYERDDDGSILKFIHLGGVIIGDDVEIGANTCIDRGTLGDTIVETGARIDNLVHVAHNVHVGERAFVIALSMIGGSTRIEDDAWIAPGAVLRNGIVIGKRATVGLGAVVTREVLPDQVVLGNPAKPRVPRV